jgi:hypothetical protein
MLNGLIVDKIGVKSWYLNDFLHREDGPAIEYPEGHKCWLLNGKMHRVDGPAIEYSNGNKEWFINGKLHRVDGPAVDFNDKKEWHLDGKQVTQEQHSKLIKLKVFW